MASIEEAKERLDSIINKARVDLYKPIQIAEVLRQSRLNNDIDISKLETFQNPSIQWRDRVTQRLLRKVSTSSARYQHDVWNLTAMPPHLLSVLDVENKSTNGCVERYIYVRFSERQSTVASIIKFLEEAEPSTFYLNELINLFENRKGIKRSIDKAYEIIAYSLFESIVTTLGTTITVSIPPENQALISEFSDLVFVLTGLKSGSDSASFPAHVYRVGVTNAADRGLDMWANFGIAIQVKHLSLREDKAEEIVDQVESDRIVIVCRDVDAKTIEIITKQISWGKRVKGIVRESDLIRWYESCLRGQFADRLADTLVEQLIDGFKAEFPQASAIVDFLEERNYLSMSVDPFWMTHEERLLHIIT